MEGFMVEVRVSHAPLIKCILRPHIIWLFKYSDGFIRDSYFNVGLKCYLTVWPCQLLVSLESLTENVKSHREPSLILNSTLVA